MPVSVAFAQKGHQQTGGETLSPKRAFRFYFFEGIHAPLRLLVRIYLFANYLTVSIKCLVNFTTIQIVAST